MEGIRTGYITRQFPETTNHMLRLVQQVVTDGVEVLDVFSIQHLYRPSDQLTVHDTV